MTIQRYKMTAIILAIIWVQINFNTLAAWSSNTSSTTVSPASSNISSATEHSNVDILFAQALKLLKLNHAYEARALLQKAAQLEPHSAGIRCNLGLAFQNSGNLDEAVVEFKQALLLRPKMPEATLNLAGCYQSQGQMQQAIDWYQRFMSENPTAPECKQIKDVIEALKTTSQQPGSDPKLPDYLEGISHEGIFRWSKQKLPIKVFIDSGDKVLGYRTSFPMLLQEAFDAWIQATNGKLAYIMVPNKDEADVVCQWTNNPAEVDESGTKSERGIAHIYATGQDINRATLKILTCPMLEQGCLSDEDMKKACLHEVGHILGLQGHSTNNHDVMFFTVDTSTVWPVLSKRDKLTIFKLYQSYPEITSPSVSQNTTAVTKHHISDT